MKKLDKEPTLKKMKALKLKMHLGFLICKIKALLISRDLKNLWKNLAVDLVKSKQELYLRNTQMRIY